MCTTLEIYNVFSYLNLKIESSVYKTFLAECHEVRECDNEMKGIASKTNISILKPPLGDTHDEIPAYGKFCNHSKHVIAQKNM